jgi:conjugative transfer region protein (TIGR03748 family)
MLDFNCYSDTKLHKVIRLVFVAVMLLMSFSNANAFSLFGWLSSSDKLQQSNKIVRHTADTVIIAHKHQPFASTQVSRYTFAKEYIPNQQSNLLDQNISIIFNNKVATIDGAITLLLFNSGFRLQAQNHQDQFTKLMLANSLPATQKSIKNATLKQTLLALTGRKFKIVVDPIHRLISFKIKPTVLAIYLNNKGDINE